MKTWSLLCGISKMDLVSMNGLSHDVGWKTGSKRQENSLCSPTLLKIHLNISVFWFP